tara:strand:+ start:8155 stop:9324 length:1170 start_codon:yes stop_codon:yes gene_type:complete
MLESPPKLTRRNVLLGGLILPFSIKSLFASHAHSTTIPFLDDTFNPSIITKNKDKIIPFTLTHLTHWITPTDQFYIRNHFAVPDVSDTDQWIIHIHGRVQRSHDLSFAQLSDFSHVDQVVTLECAGNSKHRNHGLVSNARWTGVPLRTVLDRVQVTPDATHVVFHGADTDTEKNRHFSRALTIKQAMQSEVMLATKMNGAPLPPDHGFPIRLIVPGWYGMAHVKWLKRIELISHPFDGRYQTTFYVNKRRTDRGSAVLWTPEPITKIPVKSIIARIQYDQYSQGTVYQASGAIWGGNRPTTSIHVHINDASQWKEATLHEPSDPFAWTLWSYQWNNPLPGPHKLMSRGTDHAGNIQPIKRSTHLYGPYQHDEVIVRRVHLSRENKKPRH